MSNKIKTPRTSAMESRPARQLPFVPQISQSQKLTTNEDWARTARGYLKDPNFLRGIQSLNLQDQQTLGNARAFINPNNPKIIKDLRFQAQQLGKNSSVEPVAEKNDRQGIWLRMAKMVYGVVKEREASPIHKGDFTAYVSFGCHCELVGMLLLEIVAAAASPVDNFLKRKFIANIAIPGESQPQERNYRVKRKVVDSSDDEEEEPKATAFVKDPSSTFKKSLDSSAPLRKRSKPSEDQVASRRVSAEISAKRFATLERTTDEVDPADLQAASAEPDEQSDDESRGNDSLFVPQKGAVSKALDLPWDDAILGMEQYSVFSAKFLLQSKRRRLKIAGRCLTCNENIPTGPSCKNVQCAACKEQKPLGGVLPRQTDNQQRPVATAVMVAPRSSDSVASQVKPSEQVVIDEGGHGVLGRDFAPKPQASTVKSMQTQETRFEVSMGVMSDMVLVKEAEKEGLKTVISGKNGQIRRQECEIEQLKARIQQLEQQAKRNKAEGLTAQMN